MSWMCEKKTHNKHVHIVNLLSYFIWDLDHNSIVFMTTHNSIYFIFYIISSFILITACRGTKYVDGRCPICKRTESLSSSYRVVAKYTTSGGETNTITMFRNDLSQIVENNLDLSNTNTLLIQLCTNLPIKISAIISGLFLIGSRSREVVLINIIYLYFHTHNLNHISS